MRIPYKLHYRIRRLVNYVLLKTLHRFRYPNLDENMLIYSAQSFSKASIEFLEREMAQGILSSAPDFSKESVVLDVGAEKGIWAMQIYDKYAMCLKLFEPNPHSISQLEETFSDKPAEIFPFGLGASDQTCLLSDDGMGSSIFSSSRNFDTSDKIEIQIRDVNVVFEELGLEEVDMIKINIEGGEYELVPRLIETGLISRCRIIRIQFHDWIPNAFAMRSQIVKQLAETHGIEWSYPMVWESWIKRDSK